MDITKVKLPCEFTCKNDVSQKKFTLEPLKSQEERYTVTWDGGKSTTYSIGSVESHLWDGDWILVAPHGMKTRIKFEGEYYEESCYGWWLEDQEAVVWDDGEVYNKGYDKSCVANYVLLGGWEIYNSQRESVTEDDLALLSDNTSKKEETPVENSKTKNNHNEWTAKHYDCFYTLTEDDIKAGKVKVDSYFVNMMWGINDADKTGAGFHCLKTLNRLVKNKNSKEREIQALYGQVKRWAQLEGVKLVD